MADVKLDKEAPDEFFGGFASFLTKKGGPRGSDFDDSDDSKFDIDADALKAKLAGDDDDDDNKGSDDDSDTSDKDSDTDADSDSDSDTDDDSDTDTDADDSKKTLDKDDDSTDLSEAEPEISSFFMEKFGEKLGWSFGEEDKFESVEDVVGYIEEVIAENSKPDFANDEVQKFNEYVKQGGDLRTFYTEAYEGKIDTENVDLEKEEMQRRVVRENLKNRGYSDVRIDKFISRYEESGILEEEATDALELVKDYNTSKQEKLLKDQENYTREVQKQQQNFLNNVQEVLKGMNDVRGIPISDKQKKDLFEYIVRPEADGYTKYRKDYESSPKHLLESAFFTKEGDALLEMVKKRAKSDAQKNLQKKLKDNKGKRTKQSDDQGDDSFSSLSFLGNQLIKQP